MADSNLMRRDTRKHVRATLELAVVVSAGDGRNRSVVRFDAADVSGGGAFLRSELLLEVGEIVTLEFDLPGARHVRVRGRIVRVSRGEQEARGPGETERGRDRFPGMGVEFLDLAPEDRAAIEEQL
jgi:c-di-GMP-binding flagellar brake protein YcgR